MARPRRQSDWAPITARLSVDAARRLRVAAARMGTSPGKILDDLILKNLPDADPLPKASEASSRPAGVFTISDLEAGMRRCGMNQSDVARGLGISPKAVSEWLERQKVPAQRWDTLRRLFARPVPVSKK